MIEVFSSTQKSLQPNWWMSLRKLVCNISMWMAAKRFKALYRLAYLQQIIITTVPILIGKGIRLFGRIDQDIHLRHSKTIPFDNGFVQSWYDVLA